ncbi:hypothetical protein OROMI_025997 [Orobanche minor]
MIAKYKHEQYSDALDGSDDARTRKYAEKVLKMDSNTTEPCQTVVSFDMARVVGQLQFDSLMRITRITCRRLNLTTIKGLQMHDFMDIKFYNDPRDIKIISRGNSSSLEDLEQMVRIDREIVLYPSYISS